MRLAVSLLACILAIVSTASAQILPGTTYDPAIPTLERVVGHKPGEEISTPDQIGRYLEALAKAAPDRTRLVKYATTWEGRPLHYLIVGSRERIARLDAIRTGMQTLAAGSADGDRAIADLPVVVLLIHGVHGKSRWAARDRVGLLSTDTLLRDGTAERDPDAAPAQGQGGGAGQSTARPDTSKPFDYDKAIQPERERPENLAGAMLRVRLDRNHWLTAGLDGEIIGPGH